jgi:hypothetical protein
VNIIFGAAAGFKTTGGFWLHQDTVGILDTAEAGDQFGFAVG